MGENNKTVVPLLPPHATTVEERGEGGVESSGESVRGSLSSQPYVSVSPLHKLTSSSPKKHQDTRVCRPVCVVARWRPPRMASCILFPMSSCPPHLL